MRIYILIVLFIGLIGCKSVNHLADVQNTNIRVGSTQVSEAAISQMIAPYKVKLDLEMNEVIGVAGEDLKKGKLNSSMGNFFSDLLHEEAKQYTDKPIAFALNNYGGLRIPSITKGNITKGKIFELMPFDNTMVILETPGMQVLDLCNRIAEYGGWPVSYGISMEIIDSAAANVMICGEPLDLDKTYHIVMTDYVANGGDKCYFLKGLKQDNTGVYIREIFIAGIEGWTNEGKEIKHNPEVRIQKL